MALMSDEDVWLEVPVSGFENVYEVSNAGRVRRTTAAPSTYSGRILRANGTHPQVSLHAVGQKPVVVSVSRMVAEVFLGQCPDNLVIRHINGDTRDNRAANLEYVGAFSWCAKGEEHHASRLNDEQVRQIHCLLTESLLSLREIAEEFGVTQSTIAAIQHGATWRHLLPEPPPDLTRRNVQRKLTDAEVAEIRELLVDGEMLQYEIAERYGVTESMVSRIKHGNRR